MKILHLLIFMAVALCYANGQECVTNKGVGVCKMLSECSYLNQLWQRYSGATANERSRVLHEIHERLCPDGYKYCCADCKTPDNKDGIVKHLRKCPHLMEMFNTRNRANLIFLANSKVKINTLDVCCGPPTLTPRIAEATTPSVSPLALPEDTSDRCDSLITTPPNPDTNCCGIHLATNKRIMGGYTTSIEAYPWSAVLEYLEDGKIKSYCGGSLISNTHVVTAAHCITRNGPPVKVRLGEWDTENEGQDCEILQGDETKCNHGAISVPIHSYLVHPEYQFRQNDIALIRLSRPVEYTDFIRPICLPSAEPGDDSVLEVSGWGRVNMTHASSRYKQAVRIPFVNMQNCKHKFRYSTTLWEKQMCAGGEEGRDSCRGDSGGPLAALRRGTAHFELAGVVSFGQNCGVAGMPGVYTNVYRYRDWIQQSLRDYSGNWMTP